MPLYQPHHAHALSILYLSSTHCRPVFLLLPFAPYSFVVLSSLHIMGCHCIFILDWFVLKLPAMSIIHRLYLTLPEGPSDTNTVFEFGGGPSSALKS